MFPTIILNLALFQRFIGGNGIRFPDIIQVLGATIFDSRSFRKQPDPT